MILQQHRKSCSIKVFEKWQFKVPQYAVPQYAVLHGQNCCSYFQYLTSYSDKKICTCFVAASHRQVGRAHMLPPQYKNNHSCTHKHMHAICGAHTITSKEEKMEWEEVKGIEWVAVGEKDGERGRGRVGVSGTWLSV